MDGSYPGIILSPPRTVAEAVVMEEVAGREDRGYRSSQIYIYIYIYIYILKEDL